MGPFGCRKMPNTNKWGKTQEKIPIGFFYVRRLKKQTSLGSINLRVLMERLRLRRRKLSLNTGSTWTPLLICHGEVSAFNLSRFSTQTKILKILSIVNAIIRPVLLPKTSKKSVCIFRSCNLEVQYLCTNSAVTRIVRYDQRSLIRVFFVDRTYSMNHSLSMTSFLLNVGKKNCPHPVWVIGHGLPKQYLWNVEGGRCRILAHVWSGRICFTWELLVLDFFSVPPWLPARLDLPQRFLVDVSSPDVFCHQSMSTSRPMSFSCGQSNLKRKTVAHGWPFEPWWKTWRVLLAPLLAWFILANWQWCHSTQSKFLHVGIVLTQVPIKKRSVTASISLDMSSFWNLKHCLVVSAQSCSKCHLDWKVQCEVHQSHQPCQCAQTSVAGVDCNRESVVEWPLEVKENWSAIAPISIFTALASFFGCQSVTSVNNKRRMSPHRSLLVWSRWTTSGWRMSSPWLIFSMPHSLFTWDQWPSLLIELKSNPVVSMNKWSCCWSWSRGHTTNSQFTSIRLTTWTVQLTFWAHDTFNGTLLGAAGVVGSGKRH